MHMHGHCQGWLQLVRGPHRHGAADRRGQRSLGLPTDQAVSKQLRAVRGSRGLSMSSSARSLPYASLMPHEPRHARAGGMREMPGWQAQPDAGVEQRRP